MLDDHPKILDLVLQDLSGQGQKPAGAQGMSDEQVFRALMPAATFVLSNRERRAKRRAREIATARNRQLRREPYRDLMKVTREVCAMARLALDLVESFVATDVFGIVRQVALRLELQRLLGLSERVLDQTHRRVVEQQSVPANEKVVSIFEDHTDVIRKDYRED